MGHLDLAKLPLLNLLNLKIKKKYYIVIKV